MRQGGINDRRQPRFQTLVKVDYWTREGFFSDLVEDISEGGMFIVTPKPLSPGTRLRIQIKHPDTRNTLLLKGEVVWNRTTSYSPNEQRGMGIRFEGLGTREKTRLKEFVKKLKISA